MSLNFLKLKSLPGHGTQAPLQEPDTVRGYLAKQVLKLLKITGRHKQRPSSEDHLEQDTPQRPDGSVEREVFTGEEVLWWQVGWV